MARWLENYGTRRTFEKINVFSIENSISCFTLKTLGNVIFATTTLERIQVVLPWHITSQLRSIGYANAATMTLKIILNGMLRRWKYRVNGKLAKTALVKERDGNSAMRIWQPGTAMTHMETSSASPTELERQWARRRIVLRRSIRSRTDRYAGAVLFSNAKRCSE